MSEERRIKQQERFGVARDGDGFTDQIVVLRIGYTSDCRGWDWPNVLDEIDVELIGWAGMDGDDLGEGAHLGRPRDLTGEVTA